MSSSPLTSKDKSESRCIVSPAAPLDADNVMIGTGFELVIIGNIYSFVAVLGSASLTG